MDVRRSVREPEFDAGVNIIGTLRLLQNCVRYGVGRVIFASSGGAIYGEQEAFPAKEEHPQFPVAPYGVSKLAGERYLHFYAVEYGLRYLALRYANVYGPRQDPHGEAGVVAIFAGNLREKRLSTIYGTGEQTRDYVYVDDVVRANLLAIESAGSNGVINIGTGLETTVNQLYATMQQVAGSELPAVYAPGRPGEQTRSSIDPTKAQQQLGWTPDIALADGLRRSLESFGVIER
jgi:UDP-glucose 4-epimerase